jgi:hypothetical protein
MRDSQRSIERPAWFRKWPALTQLRQVGLFNRATADEVKQTVAGLFFTLLILDQSESEQHDDWAERGVNF